MINLLKICKIALAFSFLLFFIKPAIALEVQGYEELKVTSPGFLEALIYGVATGYAWSNGILKRRGDQEFYCQPPKISLNADNYISIVDKQIINLKKSGNIEIPVEYILFLGLVETFPC